MKFHRDILEKQVKELLRQLVANGAMNIPFPVTGRSDQWAQFYWGHPDSCVSDWQSPVIFAYDFTVFESFQGVDSDRLICNVLIGAQVNCLNIRGLEERFEEMWYKIRRLFGKNAYAMQLSGTYSITGLDNRTANYVNPRLGSLGVIRAVSLSNFPQNIEDGKIKRWTSQIEFEFSFRAALPVLGSAAVTYS